jgi:cellulose synthase/poly-beta-1,6-N-acetylglucosamine synthase-like glycosyltransferase
LKVLMCIPYTGYIPPQAAYSLPGMACYARSKGIDIDMLPIGLSLVYTARETAANTFMEGDYDALLFVDSDMKVPIDLLAKLVEADKDIVSGLAFKRFPPYEPCIFNKCERGSTQFWFDYPKGLIEIQGVGMACTLIKRKVFEKTPKPWFFPEPNIGEDLAFCIRAKEQGFKIYCDTNLICGHCTTEVVTETHYLKWRELAE